MPRKQNGARKPHERWIPLARTKNPLTRPQTCQASRHRRSPSRDSGLWLGCLINLPSTASWSCTNDHTPCNYRLLMQQLTTRETSGQQRAGTRDLLWATLTRHQNPGPNARGTSLRVLSATTQWGGVGLNVPENTSRPTGLSRRPLLAGPIRHRSPSTPVP